MPWYFVLVGMGVSIAAYLLRGHIRRRAAGADNEKFCFECNRAYPNDYVLCPRCGMRFGA